MNPVLKKIGKILPFSVRQQVKWALFPLLEKKDGRYGQAFWETFNFLQESQYWPRERLLEYQAERLHVLLQHACTNIPYYKRIFGDWGVRPEDIKTPDDLQKLPYLTKDDIKKNASDLLARNVKPDEVRLVHTSGTTGKPLQFYEEKEGRELDYAYVYHQWARVGVRPNDRIVQIRGAILNNGQQVCPESGVLRLSPKIESKQMAQWYVNKITKFGARYIHGYPSAIASFAHLVIQHELPVTFKLKAVLFASEGVYEWQRDLVNRAFGCRTFDFYGSSERVIIASECETRDDLHCIPQYGITEVDPDSSELIGTSLLNFVFPFIRYRTTDTVKIADHETCEGCNRHYFPILKQIEGRIEDFIVTPAGVLVSPAVITHPFKDLVTIKHTQIIQTDTRNVIIKVVPWDAVRDESIHKEMIHLRNELGLLFGHEINIDFQVVDELPLLKSGKFKWVKSDVSKHSLSKGI